MQSLDETDVFRRGMDERTSLNFIDTSEIIEYSHYNVSLKSNNGSQSYS